MAKALEKNFHVGAAIPVIYNGRSVRVRERHRKLQAVSVGRLWDEAKGLTTLLAVKSPVPILVAGDSAHREPAGTDVSFVGALATNEVLELFSQSSLYIASSLYEPFGLAPLEAALCGCAVVARDIPSFREVWGDAAIYFREKKDLEAVLADLASRPDRLAQARMAATDRAKRYTAEEMARDYEHLYGQLLKREPAPSRVHEVALHAS
jgi:glycogen synthase